MKKKDSEIFEKAFNELNDEGFFIDFTARAKRLQVKTRADTKKWKTGTTAGIRRAVEK